MKTNMMAGILTLTAGLATQVTFPSMALARSTHQSQTSFAKTFNLKSDLVRVKQQDGSVHMGYIQLHLDQEKYKPEELNALTAEMTGYLYFVSENKEKYIYLASDDGDVLFDLVHRGESHTYQIFGCSSTLTGCIGAPLQVSFKGPEVTLFVDWSSKFEVATWNEASKLWEESSYINLKK